MKNSLARYSGWEKLAQMSSLSIKRQGRIAPESSAYTARNPVTVSRGADGKRTVSYPGLRQNLQTQGQQKNIFRNPREFTENKSLYKTQRKMKNRLDMNLRTLLAEQKLVKHPKDPLMPAHMVNQFVGSFSVPLGAYIVDEQGNVTTLVQALDQLHADLGVSGLNVEKKAEDMGLRLDKANLSVLPINKLGIRLSRNGRDVSLGDDILVNFFPENVTVSPEDASPAFSEVSYSGGNVLNRPKFVPLHDIVAYLGMTTDLDTTGLAKLEGQELFEAQLALVQGADLQGIIQDMKSSSKARKFENLRKYEEVGKEVRNKLIQASLGDLDAIYNLEFKIVSPLEWGLMAALQDGANYATFKNFLSDPGRLSYEVHPHALSFIGSKRGRDRLAEGLSTTRLPSTLYANNSAGDVGGYLRLWSLFVPSAGRGYIGGMSDQDYISLYTQLSMLRSAQGLTGMSLDFDMYEIPGGGDVTPEYLISRLKKGLDLGLVNANQDTVNFMNRTSKYKYYRKGSNDLLSPHELGRIHPSQVTCGPADGSSNPKYWDYKAKHEYGSRWSCQPNPGASLQRALARTNNKAGRDRQAQLAAAGYDANLGRALTRGGYGTAIDRTTGKLVAQRLQEEQLARIEAAQKALQQDEATLEQIAQGLGYQGNLEALQEQMFPNRRTLQQIQSGSRNPWTFNRGGGVSGTQPLLSGEEGEDLELPSP